MGQNPAGITIFGLTIFPVYNDGYVVDQAQNSSGYIDDINITEHRKC